MHWYSGSRVCLAASLAHAIKINNSMALTSIISCFVQVKFFIHLNRRNKKATECLHLILFLLKSDLSYAKFIFLRSSEPLHMTCNG